MRSGMDLGLLRVASSAIVAMDVDGRVTDLNAAAERLFGTSAERGAGRLYPDVFGASLAERIVGLFLRIARSGDAATPLLVEATLPSGRRATLRAGAGPLRDASGGLVGMFFVAEDQTEARERAQHEESLRDALHRYLGDAVAERIDERPSFVGVGGTRQTVSVLHADVRGYTTIAEELEPEQTSALLIRYHGAAVAALLAVGATLDRFIGDAILALWNAPRTQEGHPRLAVRGALALQGSTREVGTELRYGVGLHTGEAVVGNLGSERYMNYTAVGDTVNVAARLQSAAPPGDVVCSAGLLAAAGPGVRATALGPLAVKGRRAPVEAYRVEGLDE